MEPMSRGKGRDNYTLYYPLYISHNLLKINIDKKVLVNVLRRILPNKKVTIDILPRTDVTIIKITNNETLDDAKNLFHILQKYFINLSIQKSFTIYLNWDIEGPKPCPFNFFSSWSEAEIMGWDTGEGENFNADGIIDITKPCIVPENKKIVDADVLIGRSGSRNISMKDLIEAMVENPLPGLSDRQKLAINSFLTSFSLPDHRLAYLLTFISLEVLAADHNKLPHYAKQKHFFRLLSDYKKDIMKELNLKNHLEFNPESITKDLYGLRNDIAHKLNLDSAAPTEFIDACHIAKVCATTIIKKMISSQRKES